ncbi:hypothetical protein CPLU01_07275 [Colletotrichum plurivorum]|uniref:Uncharacterized protein n=1 Tax=Colletotrichum plurivorum TaxID=2175906 RepID=A0A8H6NFD4_9PEZI|nr:hypothetical protein CPLU01_07275 [Colletotrichum plurivorum]
MHRDMNKTSGRGQWRALGVLGLCTLGLGTLLIAGAVVLLGYFWHMSIRAKDGEVAHSQLWNRIVFSNWASRVVTITAALLRVCLGLQMGVFTAMAASLMIERAGVPLHSAPLISMLRAVPASPYSLLTAFVMSRQKKPIYTFALIASVSLTVGFQFASTALLSDFDLVNVTSAPTVANVSLFANPGGRNSDGLKLWNSQPLTYIRFAERPRTPLAAEQLPGNFEDTGHILRAVLPFETEASRSRLRRYEGPAAVIDSRVACVRPNITDSYFTILGANFGSSGYSLSEEIFVRGSFEFSDDYDGLPIDKETESQSFNSWPFNCVVPIGASGTSICSLNPDDLTDMGPIYSYMPSLSNTNTSLSTTIFLVFKSVGATHHWMEVLSNLGNMTDVDIVSHLAQWEADASDWPMTADGIWSRIHLPDTNHSISVSACFTVLGGTLHNVSMSSDKNGPEPSLHWDNGTAQFNTDVIRSRYWNPGNQTHTMNSQGILTLDSWENEKAHANIRLSASASRLPSIDEYRFSDPGKFLPCGILGSGVMGADSSRALHYAHSALFHDVMNTTGSLAEALQAVLMVTQQMEYYEHAPQVREVWRSPASHIMAEEKLIPVQWLGFTVIAGMIAIHFLLLITAAVLFLMFTKASWIGNVWMSLGQVVSAETEDIIRKSTCKDDSEVKRLTKMRKTPGGLRERMKVRKNEMNERYEIGSF